MVDVITPSGSGILEQLNDTQWGFRPTGVASATDLLTRADGDARYTGASEPQIFDVRAAGAVGDGSADDTAAIQAAYDELRAVANGNPRFRRRLKLYIPASTVGDGTYRITSPINLSPDSVWLEIYGGGVLKQVNDTGHFNILAPTQGFPANGVKQWVIRDLEFAWSPARTSTNAVAIKSSSIINGLTVMQCNFREGRRGIQPLAGSYGSNIWLLNGDYQSMAGALLWHEGAGNTTVVVEKWWMQNPSLLEEVIHAESCQSLVLRDLSLEAVNAGNNAVFVRVEDSTNVTVDACRLEWGTILNGTPVFYIQNSQSSLNISNLELRSLDVGAGNTETLFRVYQGDCHISGTISLISSDIGTGGQLFLTDPDFGGEIYWHGVFRTNSITGGGAANIYSVPTAKQAAFNDNVTVVPPAG